MNVESSVLPVLQKMGRITLLLNYMATFRNVFPFPFELRLAGSLIFALLLCENKTNTRFMVQASVRRFFYPRPFCPRIEEDLFWWWLAQFAEWLYKVG